MTIKYDLHMHMFKECFFFTFVTVKNNKRESISGGFLYYTVQTCVDVLRSTLLIVGLN